MLIKFGAAAALIAAFLFAFFATSAAAGSTDTPAYADLLVRFQPGLSRAEINQALDARGLTRAEYSDDLDLTRAQLKAGTRADAALTSLQRDPRVTLVEPNYIVKPAETRPIHFTVPLFRAFTENDPLFHRQWGLIRIKAPEVWSLATHAPMDIAIIDSGIDRTHPDLRGRVLAGYNFVDPGAPAFDDSGHGTFMAGIAAAIQNNHVGIAGTATNARLIPLKVLQADTGTMQNVALAIHEAARRHARVANLSLGGTTVDGRCPQYLREQIAYAHARGVLIVAAAGNYVDERFFPAACDYVIAVNSTDVNDRPSGFDNAGAWVDLSAPGEDIISTMLGGGYDYHSGTSVSTPFVAGAGALLFGKNPEQSPDEVERALEHSADRFGTTGHSPLYGWGRLNVARAMTGQ